MKNILHLKKSNKSSQLAILRILVVSWKSILLWSFFELWHLRSLQKLKCFQLRTYIALSHTKLRKNFNSFCWFLKKLRQGVVKFKRFYQQI